MFFILLSLVGWMSAGAFGVAVMIYHDPQAFHTGGYYQPRQLDKFTVALSTLGGPVVLLFAIFFRLFLFADDARKRKEERQAQLEQELEAAKREIDALLRRDKADA